MKIQKGKYVICDPCFALNDERYEKLLECITTDVKNYDETKLYKENDFVCYALSTACGVGEYFSRISLAEHPMKILSDLLPIGVDSGMIAITSIELATELDKYDSPVGILIEVLDEIEVQDIYGDLFFGSIIIKTDLHEELKDDWHDQWEHDCRNYFF